MRRACTASLAPLRAAAPAASAVGPVSALWRAAASSTNVGDGKSSIRRYPHHFHHSSAKCLDLTSLPRKSSQRIDYVQSTCPAVHLSHFISFHLNFLN
jgi:hypothetical protein